jgi:hypothetical protein
MGNTWGAFEVFVDDVKQIADDGWQLLKLPLEVLYNDYKILLWAWDNKLLGLSAFVAGGLWGAVVLQKMPGDFAYIGPFLGAFSGTWGVYYLSTIMSGGTPPDWTIVSVNNPNEPLSGAVSKLSDVVQFIAWFALQPWKSNTSFLAGATVGWLIAPNFPMSAVALGGGIAGIATAYALWNDLPASLPSSAPAINDTAAKEYVATY